MDSTPETQVQETSMPPPSQPIQVISEAEDGPETQVQETSMPPPPLPIQVISGAEDDRPSVPTAEGLPSPFKNPSCVKKTLAKIQYQYELNIDPPEQDATAKREIMRYIADNLKMEYKFHGKPLFVFSPMNVTEEDDRPYPRGEETPCSFSVEGIKTTESWDSGRYETNMTIQLKKRRQALEVVQAEPDLEQVERSQDQPGEDEDDNFGNSFQFVAFGVVLALLLRLAMKLIFPIDI